MIPVGTSVNPGELRSGPNWEKTFISCLGVPDTPTGTHLVYILNFVSDTTPLFGHGSLLDSIEYSFMRVLQFETVKI